MNANVRNRTAMTLAELLIVITVLLVLAAIAIPAVRVVTKDRGIRESARVVNAYFATARDDAVVRGFAGIELVRNQNFANGCTRLYRLRALPPYMGDDFGATVTVANTMGVYNLTFGMGGPGVGVVNDGDYIKFNHKLPLYEIEDAATMELHIDPSQPAPPTGVAMTYQVIRRPIRVESSYVDLPNGYFIDLDVSGDLSGQFTASPESVFVLFDGSGRIDKIFPGGWDNGHQHGNGTLYFLVASDDEVSNPGADTLDNMANLWVSVNYLNGSSTVNEIAETSGPINAARISASRELARKKRNANQ